MSLILLLVVVLAWGFSWYGIILQVNVGLDPIVTVAYRFILAAIVLLAGLGLTGRLRAIPARDHPWVFALGFCLFSMNYFCFYTAAAYLPSGLLSVIFATAAIMGVFNQWLILRRGLDRRVLIAAPAGVLGLGLLLWPEISAAGAFNWWAVILPVCGTYLFSLGNLVSARLSARHDLPVVVAYAMAYGAAICVALSLLGGSAIFLPADPVFWGALVFLAIVSSIVAFLAYLHLVNREGPARAAYATVLFPIVAMGVSAVMEGYAWTIWSSLGLALALGGTVAVFSRAKTPKPS